jgi:2'-5' RNA ligase
MDSVRLFVAIVPPASVTEAIVAYQLTLSRALPGDPVKWIPEGNLHLTIQFMGDTPTQKLTDATEAIRRAVAGVADANLSLRIDGAGAFPRLSRARTLWLGLSGDTEGICDLNMALRHELDQRGVSYDTKPFRPHLTVGYVRKNRSGTDLKAIQHAIEHTQTPSARFGIESIDLVRSDLSPSGAHYTVIGRAHFG